MELIAFLFFSDTGLAGVLEAYKGRRRICLDITHIAKRDLTFQNTRADLARIVNLFKENRMLLDTGCVEGVAVRTHGDDQLVIVQLKKFSLV